MRLPRAPTVALLLLPAVVTVVGLGQRVGAQDDPAHDRYRGQVVVLRPANVDELTQTALARVTGELVAARFQVSVVDLDPGRDPALQVETVAPELQPVAAFAIAHANEAPVGTMAIWVCDRLGRRTTIQRMTMRDKTSSQEAEVLAVEAIELIRVSMAGRWPDPSRAGVDGAPGATAGADSHAAEARAPRRADTPARVEASAASIDAPGPVPSVASSWAHHFPELSVGLGVALLQDAAVSAVEWTGSLTSMLSWSGGFALRGQVRGLGPSVTAQGSHGSAEIHRQAASLGAAWQFWPAERVQPFLTSGFGLEHMGVNGISDDPARRRSTSSWSGLLSAGVGATAALGRVFALGVELDGVIALPATVLRIGDTATRRFGRPGMLLSAGLQARF